MIRRTLLFLFSVAAFGQTVTQAPAASTVTVSVRPTLQYAHYEIWFFYISNENATSISVSRESLLQKFPLAPLPNDIASDILTAAASKNPHSWIPKAWTIISPMAITGLDATAIETKKNGPIYISGGIAIANLFVQLVAQNAPNPGKYFGEALPTGNAIIPANGGSTFGVVTAWSKSDVPLGPFLVAGK